MYSEMFVFVVVTRVILFVEEIHLCRVVLKMKTTWLFTYLVHKESSDPVLVGKKKKIFMDHSQNECSWSQVLLTCNKRICPLEVRLVAFPRIIPFALAAR